MGGRAQDGTRTGVLLDGGRRFRGRRWRNEGLRWHSWFLVQFGGHQDFGSQTDDAGLWMMVMGLDWLMFGRGLWGFRERRPAGWSWSKRRLIDCWGALRSGGDLRDAETVVISDLAVAETDCVWCAEEDFLFYPLDPVFGFEFDCEIDAADLDRLLLGSGESGLSVAEGNPHGVADKADEGYFADLGQFLDEGAH